jgi:hypothetical protein
MDRHADNGKFYIQIPTPARIIHGVGWTV